MRILLFGASGGIGSEVRARALVEGHELVLFGRDAAKLEPLAATESVVAGDIADASLVAASVAGVDAVVSALGPSSNSRDQVELFESFARVMVEAMTTSNVSRLVAVSGGACTLPGERKRIGARLASAFVRLAVPHVVAAKQRELEIIFASGLEWTLPRPPRVVAAPATGSYRAGAAATGMSITQGDLAAFMVDQLTDATFVRRAPFVSN